MVSFIRADGNWVGERPMTRRSLATALAGGYAVAAFSVDAEPITTDTVGILTETVDIQTADRKIPGFLARPAAPSKAKGGKHPVVFVNSEIFGVHEWVKDICRRLAKAGYVALAPDLFVRAGDPSKTTDFKVIMDIVKAQPEPQVLGDTTASLKFLAAQPYADMKRLGVTGFCWGGGATWRCCETFPEFKAGVAWYGPLKAGAYPRKAPIEAVAELKAPVLGLYGALDKGIPQKDVEDMRAALAAAGRKDEIIVYPNADHGFLADYRASFNADAAKDGWARMLAFFKKNGVA